MGEVFHITTKNTIKWDSVLSIYKKVFKDVIGREIRIKYIDDPKPIYEEMRNKYQVIYDRLFDRRFDNSKFLCVAGDTSFESPEIGLERCMVSASKDSVPDYP